MRTLLLLLPALILSGQTTPAPKAAATVKTASMTKAPAAPSRDYKESGSPTATVEIDAYTDYECPIVRASLKTSCRNSRRITSRPAK